MVASSGHSFVNAPAFRLVALVIAGALAAGWWLRKDDAPVLPARAEAAPPQVEVPPSSESRVDAPAAAPAAQPTAPSTVSSAPKVTGKLSFIRGAERLELQVGGGAALWDPANHRLRVLLTDEPLNPAQQRQLLGYLRDERLADSGQAYGVLDLQFRPDATTLDRSSLASASLTVAASGGLAHDTADVLSSLQWSGQMQPKSGAGTPPQLELSAAGNARSADGSPTQQDWQLSVAVPVVEAPGL